MAEKSKRAKITTSVVEKLRPGEVVGDTDLPGFAVRRQQDARVYFVRKHANGRRHFVTIGEHGKEGWTAHKARQSALMIIAALKQGRDPASERSKSRGMPTLAEFGETFINEHGATLKPGTVAVYSSMFRTHVAPCDGNGQLEPGGLGRIRLDQVTAQQIAALHRSLKETPRTANHVLALLSSIYSYAQTAGHVPEGHNPTSRIKRFATYPRQRFLTEDELARLGDTLAEAEDDGSEDPYAIAAIRLLILTGCRRDEILDARWDWVDFQRGLLNLPDSKTGAKPVHLNQAALELLQELPRVDGNPYIIVGAREGRRWVNLRKVWVRIRNRADLTPTTTKDGRMQEVRLHDLRHSFASLLAASGASLHMIGKLLGHSNPQTTARYAHLADDPLRKLSDEAGARAMRRKPKKSLKKG